MWVWQVSDHYLFIQLLIPQFVDQSPCQWQGLVATNTSSNLTNKFLFELMSLSKYHCWFNFGVYKIHSTQCHWADSLQNKLQLMRSKLQTKELQEVVISVMLLWLRLWPVCAHIFCFCCIFILQTLQSRLWAFIRSGGRPSVSWNRRIIYLCVSGSVRVSSRFSDKEASPELALAGSALHWLHLTLRPSELHRFPPALLPWYHLLVFFCKCVVSVSCCTLHTTPGSV